MPSLEDAASKRVKGRVEEALAESSARADQENPGPKGDKPAPADGDQPAPANRDKPDIRGMLARVRAEQKQAEQMRKAQGQGKQKGNPIPPGRWGKLEHMSRWQNIFHETVNAPPAKMKADTQSAVEDAMQVMWLMLMMLLRMLFSLFGSLIPSWPKSAKDLAEMKIRAVDNMLKDRQEELERDIATLEGMENKFKEGELDIDQLSEEERKLAEKHGINTRADLDEVLGKHRAELEAVNERLETLDSIKGELDAEPDLNAENVQKNELGEQVLDAMKLNTLLDKVKEKAKQAEAEGRTLQPDDLTDLTPEEKALLEKNGITDTALTDGKVTADAVGAMQDINSELIEEAQRNLEDPTVVAEDGVALEEGGAELSHEEEVKVKPEADARVDGEEQAATVERESPKPENPEPDSGAENADAEQDAAKRKELEDAEARATAEAEEQVARVKPENPEPENPKPDNGAEDADAEAVLAAEQQAAAQRKELADAEARAKAEAKEQAATVERESPKPEPLRDGDDRAREQQEEREKAEREAAERVKREEQAARAEDGSGPAHTKPKGEPNPGKPDGNGGEADRPGDLDQHAEDVTRRAKEQAAAEERQRVSQGQQGEAGMTGLESKPDSRPAPTLFEMARERMIQQERERKAEADRKAKAKAEADGPKETAGNGNSPSMNPR